MKNEEFYYGFDSEKQTAYEKELIEKGVLTQEFVDECKEVRKDWTEEYKATFLREGEDINKDFVAAIEKGLTPSSSEVQTLVRRQYAWITVHWTPTKKEYLDLVQLWQTPEFKTFYDHHHPKLLAFLVEATGIFAESELN